MMKPTSPMKWLLGRPLPRIRRTPAAGSVLDQRGYRCTSVPYAGCLSEKGFVVFPRICTKQQQWPTVTVHPKVRFSSSSSSSPDKPKEPKAKTDTQTETEADTAQKPSDDATSSQQKTTDAEAVLETTEKKKKPSLKEIIKLYGKPALGIYVALYFAPLIGGYYLLRAVLQTNNFGLDPIGLLDYVGMREKAFKLLNADPESGASALKPWQLSFLLSYVANQFVEIVRLPATIALAPKLHKMLNKPKEQPKRAPPPDPEAAEEAKHGGGKEHASSESSSSTSTR